jgi:hypothetical protein
MSSRSGTGRVPPKCWHSADSSRALELRGRQQTGLLAVEFRKDARREVPPNSREDVRGIVGDGYRRTRRRGWLHTCEERRYIDCIVATQKGSV